ncbi:MAG TPA: wax ester/triacylglycerol synthase family O-acyltransferase [Baekduia sp.]|nr:wax ester/triacylglycerol synthase family O-acyltransferase [Baekduia sp.]
MASPKVSPVRQLSSLDVQFLLDSDRNYGHVGSVAILDPKTAPGEFTVESLRELIMDRIHLVPPFTSRMVRVPLDLDWPYWVPDRHFDIGYHVRELALPKPGSMEQLAEQVARIYSRRLDQARPLWELYLIHGPKGGKVAMVSKAHHAAVDGMSGGEIMSILFDVTPEPREVDPPTENGSVSVPTNTEMIGRAFKSLPKAPFRFADRLGRLLPHVDVVPSVLGAPGTEHMSRTLSKFRQAVGIEDRADVLVRPKFSPPRGAYDDLLSPHRIFGFGSISLNDVKEIKDHFGVKVNDVVVTLVAATLREHMLLHDMLPDRPLIAQVPVSVRSDDEFGTFGNEISLMFVPIPTRTSTAWSISSTPLSTSCRTPRSATTRCPPRRCATSPSSSPRLCTSVRRERCSALRASGSARRTTSSSPTCPGRRSTSTARAPSSRRSTRCRSSSTAPRST